MMFCSKCGTQFEEAAQFCGKCGAGMPNDKDIAHRSFRLTKPILHSADADKTIRLSKSARVAIGILLGGLGMLGAEMAIQRLNGGIDSLNQPEQLTSGSPSASQATVGQAATLTQAAVRVPAAPAATSENHTVAQSNPATDTTDWSVHIDNQVVVIAYTGAVSDKGNFFSLRLVCDGRDKERLLELSAWDKDPTKISDPKPRDLQWNENRGVWYRESVDDGSLKQQVLARNGDQLNSGKLLIFGVTIFDDTVAEPFPKERLILKDIFLDETVTFKFGTMAGDDRATVQKMCRFPEAR
jgi:hypothetical protein